jgi:hypothetical protein
MIDSVDILEIEWVALDDIRRGEILYLSYDLLDSQEYHLIANGNPACGKPFIFRKSAELAE